MTEPVQSAGSSSDRPEPLPPRLCIDWGAELAPGRDVAPEFHIFCPGLPGRPYVIAELETRLDQTHWNRFPRPEPHGEYHWVFTEAMRLVLPQGVEGGTYRLCVRVIFPEAGGKQRCYTSGGLRFDVSVEKEGGADGDKRLHIEGTGAALLNLSGVDLRKFSDIHLKAGDQAVVNIQQMLDFLSTQSSSDENAKADPKRWVAQVAPVPDADMERHVPRNRAAGLEVHRDCLALVLPGGRRTLVLARSSVQFGRERDESGLTGNDVVLRLWPLTPERKTLSARISKRHFTLALQPEGLRLTDTSSCGTFVDDRPVDGSLVLKTSDPSTSYHIDAAGMLRLDLAVHRDPTWADWDGREELADQLYWRIAGRSRGEWQGWQLARSASVDAVRLRRVRLLPVRKYLTHLSQRLHQNPKLLDEIRRIAGTDPVDQLADREEYVLVFRSATIGSAKTDAVRLAAPGICPNHARILQLDGALWLEHLHERGQTWIGDEPLAPHTLAPLVPGTKVRFGEAEVSVEEFSQVTIALTGP